MPTLQAVASKLHGVEVEIEIIKRKGDPMDESEKNDVFAQQIQQLATTNLVEPNNNQNSNNNNVAGIDSGSTNNNNYDNEDEIGEELPQNSKRQPNGK